MRNLKRALSLTLASVMLLGMMVVGAGAAGFPDVDEDNANIEAIEVLQAVEVMIGDDNGNFGPNDPVNRSQMAVVMAKLLNLDYQYYEASCPFWDVPTWARPYVGACYANKIVSGYGDGTYGAADGVTPVQAASMMMRALGYFQHSEDYQDGFETATVRQGTEVGIFEGVGSSATANMTRAQVARMALNALESEMVTFTGIPGVTVGDATIGYRAEYTPRTSTETKYQAIEKRTSDVSGGNNLNRGQYYIQLGEELYNGKLTKKYDTDDFERPSINWQFNGKEIGVYVDYDLLVAGGSFTNAVKYSELYNLLTFTTINDNSLYRYVDGVDQKESKDKFSRSNKDEVGGTGVLTEVFYNQDREEITITSINTYLAKANSDYNKTNETLSLKVYETNGTGTTKIVDSEDVEEAAGVAKDDFRLVYMSGKNNAAKLEVVKIFDVEIMTGSQITKWSKHDTKVVDKLTTEGTEYKTNPKAYYDKNGDVLLAYNEQRLTDTSYNIFMDRYNNVIGVDLYEGTKNYVFITGYDRIQSNISVKTADAAAIFMDGTMDIVTVNVTDTDKNIRKAGSNNYIEWSQYSYEGVRDLNRWYTYTQAANGNYTLKPVDRFFYTSYDSVNDFDNKGVKVLNTANLYLNDSNKTNGYNNKGRIYGNDDSVYITVEPGYVDTSKPTGSHDAITDVKGVYTGAQDVKLEITTTSKELVNERKGEDHTTSVYPNTSVDYTKVDYDKWNAPYEQNAYVYSIYDSNYYIIASVVLGDAQGATANYAYILDDAKSEWVEHGSSSRSTSDDTYFWEFEAVLNGEKQTLTVKSKYEDTIDDLRPYHMQELRFDGDYVTAIKDVDSDKVMITNTDEWKTDEYDVYDVGHTTTEVAQAAWADSQNIHTAMSDRNIHSGSGEYTHSNHRIDGTIELVGRTLYTERDKDDVGLALTSDAKAVLIQKENKDVETIQCDSVAEAIGRLADADTRDVPAADGIQFHGRIVAVLDSAGAAKWVVIISDTLLLTGNQPSYGDTSDLRWVQYNEITGTGRYWELYIPGYVDATTVSSETIRNALASNGCSDISRNGSNWNFYRNGTRYENQVVRVVTTYWGDDTIHVTGVTLDKATATVKAGEKVTLVATVAPSNATNKAVTWTSSDNTVATVSNGVVTGVKAGTATITVTTADRGYTASCTVTVEDDNIESGLAVTVKTSGFLMVNIMKNGTNLSKTSANYTLDAEKVTGIQTGDTITFDPADAVVVDGVNSSGKVTKQVITIKAAEGWSYNTMLGQWRGPNGYVMSENPWPEVAGLAAASLTPKRFGFARTTTNEEDLSWTSGPNWFRDAILAGWTTIELRATVTVDGQKVEAVEILTITYNEDGSFEMKSTLGEGTTQAALDAMYAAAVTDRESVKAVGVEKGESKGETVTLSLKGAALAKDTVAVYNGSPRVETKAVDTVSEAIYYTASVTSGNTITLKNVSGVVEGTYLFDVDGKELAVTVKGSQITFKMPAKDFTLDTDANNKLKDGKIVKVVTLKDGVTAGYSAKEGDPLTAMKTNQDNYVPEGSYVTITGNGTGTKVVTKSYVAVPNEKAGDEETTADIFDADKENNEKHGQQFQVKADDVVLRSAIKVELSAGDNTTAKIGVAKVIDGKNAAWVALGEKVTFEDTTTKYGGYLVNKAAGDKVSFNEWTVAGAEDVKVYGAWEIKLDGVTAKYGEKSGDETLALANGQYLADGKFLKATAVAADGTDVVEAAPDTYVWHKTYKDGEVKKSVNLTAATKVSVNVGVVTKWGLSKDGCTAELPAAPSAADEPQATKPQILYVKNGTYLKVDGTKGNKGVPAAYEGETLLEMGASDTKELIFKVGTKLVGVSLGDNAMTGKVQEFLKDIRSKVAAESVKGIAVDVQGNELIVKGNLHYVGKKMAGETIDPPYEVSVAKDLSTFLKELHKGNNKLGIAAISEIEYNGKVYTWTEGGGKNPFRNGSDSIIADIVKDTADSLNKVGDFATVTMKANGLIIKFTVMVDDGAMPYSVESLIQAVRAELKQRGIEDNGTISIKGNVITAAGDLEYAGATFQGKKEAEASKIEGTVAQDLHHFLMVMHDLCEANSVKFGEKVYAWSDSVSNKNPYVNNNTSIIAGVVNAAKEDSFWAINDETSEGEIKLTVDGMEIIFKVVINGKITIPESKA